MTLLSSLYSFFFEEEKVPSLPNPVGQTWQFGGQYIKTPSIIQDIRKLFGLSGNIKIERKIRRQIKGEVLSQIHHDQNFFGTVYDKIQSDQDLDGIVYNNIHKNIETGGSIFKPLQLYNDLSGLTYENKVLNKDIVGQIFKNIYTDTILNGRILTPIQKVDVIYGKVLRNSYQNFIIKGYVEYNLTKRNLMAMMTLGDEWIPITKVLMRSKNYN